MLRSPYDDRVESKRLVLIQDDNFSRFSVSESIKIDFTGWHYNKFGKQVRFREI
jgi:hypothetical protein